MRKMKNSGIEWIGEIPEDWEIRRTKVIANSMHKGNGITKEQIVQDGDSPCVRYGEIYSKYDNVFYECKTRTNKSFYNVLQYFSFGDILFACTGELPEEIGKNIVYLGNEKCLAGGDIIVLSHSQEPRFLSYVYNSYGQTQKSCGKTKLKVVHISASEIANIFVALPPLSEQQQIADFLDEKVSQIDSTISKTRESIEEYKKLRQAIITEAVTGKVKIENGKVKESEMLELKGDNLPNGWRWMKLKFLIDKNLQYGANDSGIEYNPILPRYVRITDIDSNGKLKNDEMLSLSEENSKDYFLEEGDILFARSGASVGKTFIYKAEYGRCCFAGYLIRAKLNKKIINPQFFFYYTLSSKYDIWKNGIFIQSTIQNIGADKYSNLEVPVPPLNSQLSLITFLDKKCSEIDKLITKKEQLVVELEAYKKSLIYEVVTGKRSV